MTSDEAVITQVLTKNEVKAQHGPDVLENAGLENSKPADKQPSIEDQAAKAFSNLMPIWKRFRKSLNYGAFERVSTAIMEFPLADEYPKFKNQQELEAFKIGCTIMDAKNIMISHSFSEKFKQRGEAVVSPEQGEDSGK